LRALAGAQVVVRDLPVDAERASGARPRYGLHNVGANVAASAAPERTSVVY
jgi:hypothetical protein